MESCQMTFLLISGDLSAHVGCKILRVVASLMHVGYIALELHDECNRADVNFVLNFVI